MFSKALKKKSNVAVAVVVVIVLIVALIVGLSVGLTMKHPTHPNPTHSNPTHPIYTPPQDRCQGIMDKCKDTYGNSGPDLYNCVAKHGC